jgi:hypothetical protein
MKYRVFLFAIIAACLASCGRGYKVKPEIEQVDVKPVEIKRFDQALFGQDVFEHPDKLRLLQQDFEVFLDDDINDTVFIRSLNEFISDSAIQNIHAHTMQQFPDLAWLEKELTLAFKHIKFYFPDWVAPRVYTYVSGLFYEMPVQYSGEELIIALDMYLGEEFVLYQKIGIPLYKIRRMTTGHIVADCVDEIIRAHFTTPSVPQNLLDKMITEGRLLYLMDVFIPWVDDHYKIRYSKEQLKWSKNHESNVWAYFIENQLLFNSDPLIVNRFVSDGPFTSVFHRDSPPRVGIWTGWQITRAFMNRNKNLSPSDLIAIDDIGLILNQSGYRPGRFNF